MIWFAENIDTLKFFTGKVDSHTFHSERAKIGDVAHIVEPLVSTGDKISTEVTFGRR